jgi:hypothetical protein
MLKATLPLRTPPISLDYCGLLCLRSNVAVTTTPAISTSTSAPKTSRLRLQKSIITPSHPSVSLPITPTDRDIPKASTDTSTTTDGTNLVLQEVTASLHPLPPAPPPPQVIEEDSTQGIGVTPLQWTEDEDAELLQLRLENERYIYTRTSTRRSPYVGKFFRFVAFNDRWTWGKIRETFKMDKEKSLQRTHDSIRKRWARLQKLL